MQRAVSSVVGKTAYSPPPSGNVKWVVSKSKATRIRRSAVDFSAVPYFNHNNQQYPVADLVQDPIIADANPVKGILACQFHAAGWTWIVCQGVNR